MHLQSDLNPWAAAVCSALQLPASDVNSDDATLPASEGERARTLQLLRRCSAQTLDAVVAAGATIDAREPLVATLARLPPELHAAVVRSLLPLQGHHVVLPLSQAETCATLLHILRACELPHVSIELRDPPKQIATLSAALAEAAVSGKRRKVTADYLLATGKTLRCVMDLICQQLIGSVPRLRALALRNSNLNMCSVHMNNVLAGLQHQAEQQHFTQLRLHTAPWRLSPEASLCGLRSLQHLQLSISNPHALWQHARALSRLSRLQLGSSVEDAAAAVSDVERGGSDGYDGSGSESSDSSSDAGCASQPSGLHAFPQLMDCSVDITFAPTSSARAHATACGLLAHCISLQTALTRLALTSGIMDGAAASADYAQPCWPVAQAAKALQPLRLLEALTLSCCCDHDTAGTEPEQHRAILQLAHLTSLELHVSEGQRSTDATFDLCLLLLRGAGTALHQLRRLCCDAPFVPAAKLLACCAELAEQLPSLQQLEASVMLDASFTGYSAAASGLQALTRIAELRLTVRASCASADPDTQDDAAAAGSVMQLAEALPATLPLRGLVIENVPGEHRGSAAAMWQPWSRMAEAVGRFGQLHQLQARRQADVMNASVVLESNHAHGNKLLSTL